MPESRNPGAHCPICGAEKKPNPRYPDYICRTCALEVEDEAGRRLNITSANTADGIRVIYGDTGLERQSRECFVRGIPCRAQEAHLGGVVIQTLGSEKDGA